MKKIPTLFKRTNPAEAASGRESAARGRYSRRATTENHRFPDGVDRAGDGNVLANISKERRAELCESETLISDRCMHRKNAKIYPVNKKG